MADKNGAGRVPIELVGGYQGGRIVEPVPPPPDTPSGSSVGAKARGRQKK